MGILVRLLAPGLLPLAFQSREPRRVHINARSLSTKHSSDYESRLHTPSKYYYYIHMRYKIILCTVMICNLLRQTAFMMNLKKKFLLPYTECVTDVCLCASVCRKNYSKFCFFYSCEKLETNRIIIIIMYSYFMRRN